MNKKTLVLNASYEPLMVLCWRRAFLLTFLSKAEGISYYEEVIRTTSEEYKIPAVVRLYRRVKQINLTAIFSRRNLFKRDNYTCQYCGDSSSKNNLTMDHVVPKSRGGRKTWTNIVTSCIDCNNLKGDRTPREAKMPLLSKPKRPFLIRKKNSPKEWSPFLWG